MSAVISVILILAVLVIVLVAKAIAIVPQYKAGLVERLGIHRRSLEPGISFVTPFVDRIRIVDTGDQSIAIRPQNLVSSDNQTVDIGLILKIQVVDPVRATYEIADYRQVLTELAERTLRDAVGRLEGHRVETARGEIKDALGRALTQAATEAYGVQIVEVVIEKIAV